MQNGPLKQDNFVVILEFGGKEKQIFDSFLTAEKKQGKQNSRYDKRIAIGVLHLWLLKTFVV